MAVTGGIAAYKSAELVRLLRKQGAEVRVVMTQSAQKFVAPITFQALSGNTVHTELFDNAQEDAMGHIHLARWADMMLVAPATADSIAKFSHGIADDLISTIYLAATCPILIAPAMNQAMWNNAVTQDNIARLKTYGISVIGPEQGEQACGETGFGRMAEPETICARLFGLLQSELYEQPGLYLQDYKILISAGPTREPLDPVRYLSNRSSGKMGYALARAALRAGAEVTLVSGPVSLTAPVNATVIRVETAEQMHAAVVKIAGQHHIYIGAAAVADYSPAVMEPEKIKKAPEQITLTLKKNRDILADVALLYNRPFTVGFAAETHDLENYATNKLIQKKLDMIAANRVGGDQGGFESDLNALQVFWHGGQKTLAMADKNRIAEKLLSLIAARMSKLQQTATIEK